MSSPVTHSIFLVDDHALVREGLATLIEQEPDLRICGHADNTREAWDGILRSRPAAVIVDLSLRGESGLELIKRIQTLPDPPLVLVLSMHDDTVYAERALRAGARGYVMKRESSGKIIAGIRQVLAGRLCVTEGLAERLAGRFLGTASASSGSPVDSLSDRELEVFRRIGTGEENRQIAVALGVSLKTIQTHCAHIKEKLGLPNATLLMREAVRWVEHERQGRPPPSIGPHPTGDSSPVG